MINTFVEKSKLLPPVKTRVVRPFLSPLRIHSPVSEVGLKKNNRKRGWQFCTNCGGRGLKLPSFASDGAAVELWGFGALGCLGGGRQNSSPG